MRSQVWAFPSSRVKREETTQALPCLFVATLQDAPFRQLHLAPPLLYSLVLYVCYVVFSSDLLMTPSLDNVFINYPKLSSAIGAVLNNSGDFTITWELKGQNKIKCMF